MAIIVVVFSLLIVKLIVSLFSFLHQSEAVLAMAAYFFTEESFAPASTQQRNCRPQGKVHRKS
jgi:hypothetical protein